MQQLKQSNKNLEIMKKEKKNKIKLVIDLVINLQQNNKHKPGRTYGVGIDVGNQ